VRIGALESWVEATDPHLNGDIGDPGVIRQFREDRSAAKQKEKDTETFMRRRVQWISIGSGLVIVLKVAELLHLLPK
jgi:hypothetical protein